jgi:hypothetical protein
MNVEALKRMREMGLTFDQAIELVEMMATNGRSKGAERQARYRAKKRTSVTSDVTGDDNSDASPPLSSLSLSPTPPNQNSPIPSPPYSPPAPRKPSKADLDAIWAITPAIGRQRSGRGDLERSLTAAMRRGANPADVLAGIRAAYASPSYSGDMAKGVHRLIEGDRWQSFVDDDVGPDWEALVGLWRQTGRWASALGPPPDHPETQVPQQLRAA